jgi:hypothetical protein
MNSIVFLLLFWVKSVKDGNHEEEKISQKDSSIKAVARN